MAGVPGHYEFSACGPARTIPTADGFTLTFDGGLERLADAETVIVPGYGAWTVPPAPPVLEALSSVAARGARMMSICVGAFALAHAGILDGHRATTHWMAAPDLATRFPRVEVVPDVLYVDDGTVLTSAGIAAGLDLGLHVVRRDHGAEAAAELARFNVVAPHREGGQAQFAPRPVASAADGGLAATRAWALERLDRPLTLADLAAHALCSERTLTRRFRDETGLSPKQWVRQLRLERARELLEKPRCRSSTSPRRPDSRVPPPSAPDSPTTSTPRRPPTAAHTKAGLRRGSHLVLDLVPGKAGFHRPNPLLAVRPSGRALGGWLPDTPSAWRWGAPLRLPSIDC